MDDEDSASGKLSGEKLSKIARGEPLTAAEGSHAAGASLRPSASPASTWSHHRPK